MKRSVIMCIGNELRGDDGVALLFYDMLKRDEEVSGIADVVKIGSALTIKPAENAEKIIVIDAVDFGGEVGEVKVLELDDLDEVAGFTHKPSLRIMLGSLNTRDVYIVGIQPKNLGIGEEISEECLSAYDKVRSVILQILSS